MRGQAAINTEDQQSIVSVYKQSTLNSPSAVAGAKVDQPSTNRLFSHFFELRAEDIHTSGVKVATECDMEPVAFFAPQLFVNDLDLLIDHLSGKPVDRDVHPVVLLTFDKEACESRSIRRIAAALRDHIN